MNEKIIRQDERTNGNQYSRIHDFDEKLEIKMYKSYYNAFEFVTDQIRKELSSCSAKYNKSNDKDEYKECNKNIYKKLDNRAEEVRDMLIRDIEEAKKIF